MTTCAKCGEPLKNTNYGDICEDCWVNQLSSSRFYTAPTSELLKKPTDEDQPKPPDKAA